MRLIAMLAVTACLSAVAGTPAAHAAAEVVKVTECGYTAKNFRSEGTYVGEIDGGTAVAADLADTSGNPVTISVTCSIQVDGMGHYSEPDVVSASATGIGVVTLPPTPFQFSASPTSMIWSCTAWTLTDADVGTVTYYLDSATGELSTDPTTAFCEMGFYDPNPPPEFCDLVPDTCWIFGKES